MTPHHPQTVLAQNLVADGAIGDVAFIRAALTVSVDPGDIRRTGRLGGGASLDLGCYCISAIRLFGGQPGTVSAAQVIDNAPGADGGDLRLAATLTLPGDALAQLDVALDYPCRDELEIIRHRRKDCPCRIRGCAGAATSSWNVTAWPSDCRSTRTAPTVWGTRRTRTTTTPTASSSRPPPA